METTCGEDLACLVMKLNSIMFIFKDVPADGNCAFHAVCRSNMIPPMSHVELRSRVCQYARLEGRKIAERIFVHMASMDVTNLNLDKYIDQMSLQGTHAGSFEFAIISFLFHMNITIIRRDARLTTTSTHQTLKSFFPDLVANVSWGRSGARNLHLLHHQCGMHDVACTNPNHFGTLFPLNEKEIDDCTNLMHFVLKRLLLRNLNSTHRSMTRQDPTIYNKEKLKNTIRQKIKRLDKNARQKEQVKDTTKRRLKRENPIIRTEEQLKDTSARKLKRENPLVREKEQKQNTKSKRIKTQVRQSSHADGFEENKKTRQISKVIVASKDTDDILNLLTEATLTDDCQNDLLEPASLDDIYFSLNKFGDLMGEANLPTFLCVVCACKHTQRDVTRLPMCKVPNYRVLQARPQHKTLDKSGKWVLLEEAVYEHPPQQCLDPEGASIDHMFDIDICKLCLQQLRQGQIPLRSLVSFDTGRLPSSLASIRLTFVERMLLSCNFTIFHIFKVENATKLYTPSSSHARVSKGHCISFKHAQTRDIIEKFILPHDPMTLPKLMITAYIGPSNLIEEARELVRQTKQLTVRTQIIHLFAKEYAKLNPRNIKHDPTRFADHISGTVPDVVMNMIDFESLVEDVSLGKPTFMEMDNAMHDDYAKRDQLRPDEPADPNVDVVQTSGMVLPHLLPNGMQELKETSLHKLRTNLLAIPTSKTLVSDYDPRYFLDNYPNIFFHETGERPENVSLTVYLSILIRRPCTGAALDFSFPFEARNVLLRHRTLKRVRFTLSLEHSSIIPNITNEDLESALGSIRNKEPVNNRVKSLLKQLKITGANLCGTPQRLNRYRQQIIAGLFLLFGPFDVWITLNMQESSSQVLLWIAGEQEVPINYDIPPNVPNISRRMQICAENPMAVAEFFHIFMQAFLDALLGLPYGKNDCSPTHKGIFGWTRAYMFILEVFGKATGPHAHGFLKVQGLNRQKLIERMHDEKLVGLYKQYLLSTFSQDLPNEEFDVKLPMRPGKENDLIRARRMEEELERYARPQLIPREEHYMGMYSLRKLPLPKEESPSKEDTQEYLAKRLIRIIRECMIHEHSPTCAKNGHKGDDSDCRMSYPQPIFDDIAVFLDEHVDKESQKLIINGIEVIFPRDHSFIVAMNKWLTLAMGSNSAVYYMASGRQGRTKAIYAIEYSTKKPLSTYECIALFRASLQAKRKHQASLGMDKVHKANETLSSTMIVNRCLNALSGEVVITGYECCADVCEYPDHYASNSFVPLSGWTYMYSMLGTTTRCTFNVVSQFDAETKKQRPTLVSAIQDYMYLDVADDKKMTAFQFTAFYQRVSKKKDTLDGKHLSKPRHDRNKQHANTQTSADQLGEAMSPSDEENSHLEHKHSDEENYSNTPVGRPMHKRIGFKAQHKLCNTHHVYRVAKMRIPYQVGRRYPTLPSNIEKAMQEEQELYAQYMLSIFRPWSPTLNNELAENNTWWTTFKNYMACCEPWIHTIIGNMKLAIERDDTITKASKNMERISRNTMNHADKNFEIADDGEDWRRHPEAASELLRQLESDMIVTGLNLTRPAHEKEQVFVTNRMRRLSCRFEKMNRQPFSPNHWNNNPSLRCVLEQQFSHGDIASQIKSWRSALKKIARCNDAGTCYDMNVMSKAKESSNATSTKKFREHIDGLIKDPILMPLPDPGTASMFERTVSRPSWARLDMPPTIVKTLEEWHLTKKQAEFAILVLDHFHDLMENRHPKQLLALCLGAPGTGGSCKRCSLSFGT